MPSARAHGHVVVEYLAKELKRGSIAGPFLAPPVHKLHFNRFGLVPKSETGQWRMIIDLSFLSGVSVNDGIPDSEAHVKFSSVNDAIDMIIRCGRSCLMAKFDIKAAYRILPIHLEDRFLFGMKWREKIFIDLCLAFGLRSACKIFNNFADILAWILKFWGFTWFLIHYLDDFFLVAPPNSNECSNNLSTCKAICAELGVPLAEEKTLGPSTVITFLGIELDSVKFEARLPVPKLVKVKSAVNKFLSLKSATKRQLLSLIGYLQHCCKVIAQARPFLRRLIDLSTTVQNLDRPIRITSSAKDDLQWWNHLLVGWNGRSFFLMDKWALPADFEIPSSNGCAAILCDSWFALRWPDELNLPHISILELVPIVLAASVWGMFWQGKRLIFKCDNSSVVSVLQNKSSKSGHLMKLLRRLAVFAIKYNFAYSAIHVEGRRNPKADALSRFRFQVFRAICQNADVEPTEVDRDLFLDLLSPP